jgi:hypothetical protein
MRFQGILTYLKESDTTIKLDPHLSVCITRANDEIACVYLVPTDGPKSDSGLPIPDEYAFHNVTTDSEVPGHRDEWLISWTSSYELRRGDEIVLKIDNQRLQVVQSAFEKERDAVQ